MKEQELKLTRGIPASGKSTYAIQWVTEDPENRARVNRDDIRWELFQEYHPTPTKRLNIKQKEAMVTEVEHNRINEYLAAGKSVVADNTHLNPKAFKTYSALASANGVRLTHKDFPIEIDEALRRNAARDKKVPEEVIRRMYKNYLSPSGEFHLFPGDYTVKSFVKPNERRHAIIFDMDGTLADVSSIRHFVRGKFRNFDAFHRSSLWVPPHDSVLEMAFDTHKAGMKIVIVTARSGLYREVTQAWLDKYNVPYDNIYMRPEGDSRKDSIVKAEILKSILEDYDIVHCVDDNPNVAQVWKDAGIITTVVPGFDDELINPEPVKIDNPFKAGKCLRCGKPLKSGAAIGPRCATKI